MRNVIVTGGSRGIGLGIVTRLARADFHAIAVSRTSNDLLFKAIHDIEHDGTGRISFVSQDLSDVAALAEFSRSVRKEFGPVYGIINNVGLGTPGLLSNMSDSEIARLTQLNVTVPLIITRHLMRSMLIARSGRIINISSIVALTGYQGLAAYSATKAAMIGFTKSLARELGSLGITVNAVLPGFIETEMTEEMNERDKMKVANRAALRRLTSIDDVANMVNYLMSDEAAGVTGSTMVVDCGATA
jgi:3-oxoacyl-[acyl-carrier protein] reductase